MFVGLVTHKSEVYHVFELLHVPSAPHSLKKCPEIKWCYKINFNVCSLM